MERRAHILIADDESTFSESTADLLRKQGYYCTAAGEASAVVELVEKTSIDLLISDIRMAGNLRLELVRKLSNVEDPVPVILVTGYPTVQTAVEALHLPVIAYMIKPFEFEDLCVEVRAGIARRLFQLSVCDARLRTENACQALGKIVESFQTTPKAILSAPLRSFLSLTMHSITDGLLGLGRLTESLLASEDPRAALQVAETSLLQAQQILLQETIETLEKTKGAFKSKELGQLRKKLQKSVQSI